MTTPLQPPSQPPTQPPAQGGGQTASGAAGASPTPNGPAKPLNVSKIIMGMVIALLVSWGVIGGAVAFAVNSDAINGTKQNSANGDKDREPVPSDTPRPSTPSATPDRTPETPSQTPTSAAPLEGFEAYAATIKVTDSAVEVGGYTLKLTGEAAQQWEFVDDRGTVQRDCGNIDKLEQFCSIGHLALRDNGTDASMFRIAIVRSPADAKTLQNFGVGEPTVVPGAMDAYLYNGENATYPYYIEERAALIEFQDGLVFVIYQMEDTVLFQTQEEFDGYTGADRFKLLLSQVDGMLGQLEVTQQN
jgi:hypothetical protein